MKQHTTLIARQHLTFKTGKRAVYVKPGDRFWKTNTELDTKTRGLIQICREGKGSIGTGWLVRLDDASAFDISGG